MIIVTGAAGFIGYQMGKFLKAKGEKVMAVDFLSAFEGRSEHRDFKPDEIQDANAILSERFYEDRIFKNEKIKGIIHLGACTDTTELRVDYLNEVNLGYSQKLWNLASKFNIPFVYASSAATYGAGEEGYTDEEMSMHRLQPLNPYGESKLQFDLWAMVEEKKANHPPAWSGFKFFNVYGFGERHKQKMASVVLQGFDQITAKSELKLFKSHKAGIADGEQKRDFVYVEDVVSVLWFALTKPLKRGIYNLGSGKARSFLDLAHATFHALGLQAKIEFIDTPLSIRDRYQYFTEANMTKLKQAGYETPFHTLEEGVLKTVQNLKADRNTVH